MYTLMNVHTLPNTKLSTKVNKHTHQQEMQSQPRNITLHFTSLMPHRCKVADTGGTWKALFKCWASWRQWPRPLYCAWEDLASQTKSQMWQILLLHKWHLCRWHIKAPITVLEWLAWGRASNHKKNIPNKTGDWCSLEQASPVKLSKACQHGHQIIKLIMTPPPMYQF